MSKLKIGDSVTCGFIRPESTIVRKIRAVNFAGDTEIASADGGEICSACNRPAGTPIGLIVASWFNKVEEKDHD